MQQQIFFDVCVLISVLKIYLAFALKDQFYSLSPERLMDLILCQTVGGSICC